MTAASSVAQDRSRSDRSALLAWAGFIVLLMYALLIGGSWIGIYSLPVRVLSLFIVAVGLAVWFLLAWRRPRFRPATAIWPAVAAPLAALALATLASRFPRFGIEYLAWAVLLGALYLLLVRVLSLDYARARIGGLAGLLALVVGLIYIGWVSASWMEWWGLVGRFETPPLRPLFAGLTYGNPSAVLTVQVLLTVIAYAGLGFRGGGPRLLLITITVITSIVVVMTGSRGGWLAIAGAVVITGGLWLLTSLRSGALMRMLRDRRVQLSIGAVLLGGLIAALVLAPTVLARLTSQSDGGRLQYFATAIRMFEEAPVLGTGPGTWAVQRAAYTGPSELDWYVTHAHNLYLQTAAELGIVGLAAGLVMLAAVAWLLLRGWRNGSAVTRRWAWAAFFALLYMGLHSMVDFYANMPAVMMLTAIPLAYLDGGSTERIGLPGLSGRAWAITQNVAQGLFWVACLIAIVVLGRAEMAAAAHMQALGSLFDSAFEDARVPADEAVASDPDMTPYRVTLGLVASGQEDWETAEAAFSNAVDVDDLPMSWLGLAQAQIELDRPGQDVIDSLERAMRLGSQQPAVAYVAGALYDRIGLADRADDAYAIALAAMPDIAADESWTIDPSLSPRFEAIVAEASARHPSRAWQIALMAGDAASAHEISRAEGAPRVTTQIIDAWGGDPVSIDAVYAAADAAPTDGYILSWASRIAARAGDLDAADRYQRLAIFTADGGFLPGADISISPESWLEYNPAGTRTSFYGNWLYRRPMSPDLLAPGLPRLVILDREAEEGPDESIAADEAP